MYSLAANYLVPAQYYYCIYPYQWYQPQEAVSPETELASRGRLSKDAPEPKYKRTWNKEEIENHYKRCTKYCESSGKALQDLDIEDFALTAAGLPQTAEQCMAKVQEISSTGTLKSGVWSATEDEMLVSLMSSDTLRWGQIAKALNNQLHNGLLVRTGKKCKERWNNHLNPDIKRTKWTPEEDLRALIGYKKYGNKWSLITKDVGKRTESNTKNRIKSLLNREKQELGRNLDADLIERAILKLQQPQNE